ncbi:uncharacterized protein PHACADRAFT_176978, partial [Phanerochaete carnosa HHB-10118-sp]
PIFAQDERCTPQRALGPWTQSKLATAEGISLDNPRYFAQLLRNLGQFSLVCRAWAPSARRHLFRDNALDNAHSFRRVLN